jgi:hypothetical protein
MAGQFQYSFSSVPSVNLSLKRSASLHGNTSLPHHYPWHPRLSQKLGLFRLVQVPGSHELCFSNPKLLAQAIMDAGRD